jgi:hypothetical protein
MKYRHALAFGAMILFVAFGAMAQTNGLSDAEIQGQQLAQKILAQWVQMPSENSTNTGILKIRTTKGNTLEIPIACEITVTATNWDTTYRTLPTTNTGSFQALTFTHDPLSPGTLMSSSSSSGEYPGNNGNYGIQANANAFAGSDFWSSDLNLEFFEWPGQKVLKHETHRSRGCTVLESKNPIPSANSYSRVVSWIDNESLGIVEAYAYDANGKKLKDFYPKDFKKIAGRWQVQTLVMENVQTGSRSRLEFDLKK